LNSRWGQEIFIFFTGMRPILGSTRPHIRWASGVIWQRHEGTTDLHLMPMLRIDASVLPLRLSHHTVMLN
jgi:hypothetical protein